MLCCILDDDCGCEEVEDQPAAGASTECRAEDVADNNRVLQLTIHRTDKLKSNLYIAHPVVRVHIVNLDTGNYVKKQKRCVIATETCRYVRLLQHLTIVHGKFVCLSAYSSGCVAQLVVTDPNHGVRVLVP